ncbi:SGNH hydrolase domain-containing protein [Streptomyces sp. NPDC058759]
MTQGGPDRLRRQEFPPTTHLRTPLAGRDPRCDPRRSHSRRRIRGGRHCHRPDPLALCPPRTGICPVVVADTAVYRDDSHISEAYAEALAPVLAPSLDVE